MFKFRMYHGTKHPDTPFQFQNKGNQQQGAGFYFTSDKEDAAKYMSYTGKILECDLKFRKFISLDAKPEVKELTIMLLNAPSWENQEWDTFDDSPSKAMLKCLKRYMSEDTQHDAFLSLWTDFYRYDSFGYCNNMVKLLGYDGVILPPGYLHNDGRPKKDLPTHMVAFDPGKIKIIRQTRNYWEK